MFLHNWKEGGVKQLLSDFNVGPEVLEGATILLAEYNNFEGSGTAFVLFGRDGKLWEVNASHCSCFGLEGPGCYRGTTETKWDPEETTPEALLHRIHSTDFDDCRTELLQVIEELKTRSQVDKK